MQCIYGGKTDMGKAEFEKASDKLWEDMITNGETGIIKYRPFHDGYWTQKPRIAVCNYEAVGYGDSQTNELPFEHFKTWIKLPRTNRYTAVFVNALRRMLSKEEFTWSDMKKSYSKIQEGDGDLFKAMYDVMYMNIRPNSADTLRQEKAKTRRIVLQYKNEIRDFILALDADIFVLSTVDSANLFNDIFSIKEDPLRFKQSRQIDGMAVYSVPHFRNFDYKYYQEKAKEIAEAFLNRRSITQ
jgi:hypothetical protein